MKKGRVDFLTDNAIPLFSGILLALLLANVWPVGYEQLVRGSWVPGVRLFGLYTPNLQFLVNDVGMALFFGLGSKSCVISLREGGHLYPWRVRAPVPLLSTLAGIITPAVIYASLTLVWFGGPSTAIRGWGIVTATDMSLAWIIGRGTVFPDSPLEEEDQPPSEETTTKKSPTQTHPCVSFLLLLAIVDDAVGVLIIAAFYSDNSEPSRLLFLSLTLFAMLVAYLNTHLDWAAFNDRHPKVRGLRNHWLSVSLVCGSLSWLGLAMSGVRPALALAPIFPFCDSRTILDPFESHTKSFVESVVLFLFGLCNAGVTFSSKSIGRLTLLVPVSILLGKTLGIGGSAKIVSMVQCGGMDLPSSMDSDTATLSKLGCVGSLSLTVALFVSSVAFPKNESWESQAKLGALLATVCSVCVCFLISLLSNKHSE